MNTIVIKTQEEFDNLPDKFSEYTVIEIRSKLKIYIRKARDNSSVEARDNSSVVARDNSWVEARENSSVVAWDNSSVVARDNSSVEARDNSSAVAWDNSSVEARNNSSVEAWENSSVVARENSSVVAWDNSSVVARDNSWVDLFISAYAMILSKSVVVKKVLDYSTVVFKGTPIKIGELSETANAREIPLYIEPSFDEWLRRGYVSADGMVKKLKSQKKIGEIEVFECEEFTKKITSYVVKKGDLFSHGETVEKAIEDLRYKVGDRDASEFKHWRNNLDKEISFEQAVQAYRLLTGACELGVKEFVKSKEIPKKLTPKVILELTNGQYGHEKFKQFLTK